MTINEFIAQHKLSMTVRQTDAPADAGEWGRDASHWMCTIRCGKQSIRVAYHMGSAHKGEPQLPDVLDCLASDANGADQDFESWAADLGYDTDSRKAEKTHRACMAISRKLSRILGDEAFAKLLHLVERL